MKTLRLIALINFCIINSYSQSPVDSSELRRTLLQKEYQIFRSQNSDSVQTLLFQKAQLLKSARFYEQSYKELCRIKNNPLINNKLSYEKALVSFLRSDFGNADNQLLNIPDSVRMSQKPYLLLWLLVLSELNQWEECKMALLQTTSLSNIKESEIASLPVSVNYKSPSKALRLSSFLPGLGLIYTGNVGKGITSFGINAGFIWFAYHEYITCYFITGTFAGVYPFYRFYNGGRTLSYNLALQYNEAQDNNLNQRYRKVIFKLMN